MSDRAQRIERLTRAEPNRFPRRKPKSVLEPEATACAAAALETRVADLEKKLAEAEATKAPEKAEAVTDEPEVVGAAEAHLAARARDRAQRRE